jgi:hypothetical protein
MVRALNVKELFPAMRRSIPVAKRGGHQCRASLGIQLPSQRAEVHK